MIDLLTIESFKSFSKKDIVFGRLNILTGLNNSGKSTVLQALRMCSSANENNTPYLEGLGNYNELRSQYVDSQAPIRLALTEDGKEVSSLTLTSKYHECKSTKKRCFFEYVGADRYGPRVALPIIEDEVSHLSVGIFGQYSAHYARVFENASVTVNMRHPESAGNTLRHQLVRWMGEISPGVKLEFDVATRYDSSSIAVDGNRSTNSGFGLSYALPIVLSLLTLTGELGNDDSNDNVKSWFDYIKENGAILIIENPEAHLHPRGQTNIGKLIAMAAASGLQIFIETHSDHLLDGIRLGVKGLNGRLKGSDVKIKYFSKSEENGTHIDDVILRDDGKIDRWPQGFFDQFSLNLRALSSKNG